MSSSRTVSNISSARRIISSWDTPSPKEEEKEEVDEDDEEEEDEDEDEGAEEEEAGEEEAEDVLRLTVVEEAEAAPLGLGPGRVKKAASVPSGRAACTTLATLESTRASRLRAC